MNKALEKIINFYLKSFKPWFLAVAMYLGVLLIYFLTASMLSMYIDIDRKAVFAFFFLGGFAIDMYANEYITPRTKLKRISTKIVHDRVESEKQLKKKIASIKKHTSP